MSRKAIDLTGQRFGRLTVLKRAGSKKNQEVLWRCRCDCGKELVVCVSMLRIGHTRSCGCLRRKLDPARVEAVARRNAKDLDACLRKQEEKSRQELVDAAPTSPYLRRCHDCGRPCVDYRCEACWSRIRDGGAYSGVIQGDDAYGFGRVR